MEDKENQGSKETSEPGNAAKKSGLTDNKWLFIGVGAGALIIAIIALFLTGVIGSGKAIASVNGTKILESQLNKEYKAYEASYTQQSKKKPDAKQKKEIKKLILERLIQQELIKQAAEKEGIKVTDKELKNRVDQIKKSTSKEQLDKTLKQMNWTMDDLENMIKNQLLSTKVRDKKTKGIKVSDKDAEKYYNENKKNYAVPETATAKIATFKQNKKKDADAFLASVNGGKKFDEAVKKYIKGGVTAQQLSKDQIVGIYGKELSDAVFKLDKGGISSVVKTKNGLYVAQVDKKEKGRQKAYKEVKEEIKSMLVSQKQMEKFNTWLQSFRKKAKITIYDKELKTKGSLPASHP